MKSHLLWRSSGLKTAPNRPATAPLWLVRLEVAPLETSAHSNHFRAMGCGIEGGNGLGRNGRRLGEAVLAVGRIADQCTRQLGRIPPSCGGHHLIRASQRRRHSRWTTSTGPDHMGYWRMGADLLRRQKDGLVRLTSWN